MKGNAVSKSDTLQQLFDSAGTSAITPPEFAAQPNSLPSLPTAEAYGYWQAAFTFFNERLFQGALPNCLITLTRRPRAFGYFCAGAFQDSDGSIAHEISMNPSYFSARADIGSLSTLVHEMCHQWRHDFGKLNRKGGRGAGGYHDVVWSQKMEAVGLMPSDTGAPGGRRIGFQMTHYIIERGPFERACREMLADGHSINWRDALFRCAPATVVTAGAEPPATNSRNTRTRFVCPDCDLKAWAKASARLSCVDCTRSLVSI